MLISTTKTLFKCRSIANLRIENFGYALSDANKAIENDKASCTH